MRYNLPIMPQTSVNTHNAITKILTILVLLLACSSSHADSVDTIYTDRNYDAIGEHVTYLSEKDKPLSLKQAQTAYASGDFLQWHKPVFSFGIGTSPVWLRFTVTNNSKNDVQRRLIVENSWLDNADIFIIKDGQLVFQEKAGDSLPFTDKTIDHRFFVFEYNYPPGISEVYLRAATPDPMVLPIFFGDKDTSAARDVFNGYSAIYRRIQRNSFQN